MQLWNGSLKRVAAAAVMALVMAVAMGAVCLPSALAQTAETDAAARKARLDSLFMALGAATTDDGATTIVAEIWATWTRSGRPEVDRLMDEAANGMQTLNFGVASLLLDEVVAIAPDYAEGWNRRATLRFTMGDMAGSNDDISKVLALEPRHFGALSGRAMIHMRAGEWQQALDAYQAALKANPFLPERHEALPILQRKAAEGRL